jgi:hypothetical protein
MPAKNYKLKSKHNNVNLGRAELAYYDSSANALEEDNVQAIRRGNYM